MDINQLKYYIAVCKLGSISAAAEELHISQQGMSLAINRLEKSVGCTLLKRTSTGVVPTKEGETVLKEIEQAMRHLDRVESLGDGKQAAKANIKIAMSSSMITRLPILIQQLLITGNDRFSVQLYDKEAYSKSIIRLVKHKDIPMGIILGDNHDDKLYSRKLDYLEQVFIVNNANPLAAYDEISLEMLDGLPFVAPDKNSIPRIQLHDMFEDANISLNIVYECNRPLQTKYLVMNNPSLVSRAALEDITFEDREKIKALRLKNEMYRIPITLISKPLTELKDYEIEFLKLIENLFE